MADPPTKKLLTFVDCFLKFIDSDASQEYESLCLARSLEVCRVRWQRAEQELQKSREALLKSEIDRSALQVKLKHARNQVEVEMRKRHRTETQLEKLERQIQLIGDLLMSDGLGSKFLNEPLMAAFGDCQFGFSNMNGKNRLSVIDESGTSFISHSDISYDKTEDMELDSTIVKPARPKLQEKQRCSLAPLVGPPVAPKRTRTNMVTTTAESVNEPVVTKAENGGPAKAVSTIEVLPRRRSCRSRLSTITGLTTIWSSSDDSEMLPQISKVEPEPELETRLELEPQAKIMITSSQKKGASQHTLTSKTVIRVETCAVCSKRIRFGKQSLKCKDCHLVVHPECRENFTNVCVPSAPVKAGPVTGMLADFAPSKAPQIPYLVRQCVSEIELRGLKEKGIYRVPGCDRHIKELKRKLLHAKGEVPLGKVQDVHVVCGVLKDFLRNLREPLVTFQLNSQFMEAADIVSDTDSRTELCEAVSKLPPANRDTLAFLILHLLRVMQSPDCKMNQMSLARVFGPTIVGHSVPNPSPLKIMEDTPRQCKVMASLLSVPAAFWNQFLSSDQENMPDSVLDPEKQCERKDESNCFFRPLTSPETNTAQGASSSCCLPNKIRNVLGTPFTHSATSQTKSNHTKKTSRFFTSPNA
ncbi:rac GTPase-activating protein 1 isoform X2 [Microcaecilia unicolor]|uniref:Rac GTPase-activating protein 1-like isoform X2 n=1 Tax=Microcaecilia unicolor TaxID=1415580 RepID=A0A6P7YIR2_9AMPH|nr:rac GTPase-activating protein 1-like isoform X2 [Microcaecilia unicolor]